MHACCNWMIRVSLQDDAAQQMVEGLQRDPGQGKG